jgi:hypothetical protein
VCLDGHLFFGQLYVRTPHPAIGEYQAASQLGILEGDWSTIRPPMEYPRTHGSGNTPYQKVTFVERATLADAWMLLQRRERSSA